MKRYRAHKEAEFENIRERVRVAITQKEDKEFELNLERETAEEIRKIEEDFNKNKDKVIQMLVDKVLEVDLTIPSSVKEKFAKKK